MASEHVYDIIILILVGWLTLRGAMKGMVSQLASIAAVVASFWASVRFGPVLEPIIQSALNTQPPWGKVLAITITFVGASIAVMILHRILAKIISAIRLKKYDQVCGAAFGFLKGALIAMIITFFAIMLSEQSRAMVLQSRSGQVLVRAIQYGRTLLPEDVSVLIETNLEGFQKQVELSRDTAEQTATQMQDASHAISNLRGVFEKLQDGVSSLSRYSGTDDPADTAPVLSNESPTETSSRYSLPSFVTQRPTTIADDRTTQTAAKEEPIPFERFTSLTSNTGTIATAPHNGSYTNVSSGVSSAAGNSTFAVGTATIVSATAPPSVVAPSIDMQPMTSTTTTATASSTGTSDWRTLLRGIR